MKVSPSLLTVPVNHIDNSDLVGRSKEPSNRTSAYQNVTEEELGRRRDDNTPTQPPQPLKNTSKPTQPVDAVTKTQKRHLPPTEAQEDPKRAKTEEKPASRKTRLHDRARHKLDFSTFPQGFASVPDLTASSPLFFSHRHRRRPIFPPRFSSSEAAIAMLSKANREDHTGVRTVQLARGLPNIGSSPSQLNGGTPGGRGSVEYHVGSKGSLSDDSDDVEGLQSLSQVGITELLEQDERPTFVVDLGNRENFQSSPLHVLYANPALRYQKELFDLVSGKSAYQALDLAESFLEFKTWALSSVQKNGPLEVAPSSRIFSQIMWTHSTLRKRLRLLKGTSVSGSKSINSTPLSTSILGASSLSVLGSNGPSLNSMNGIDTTNREPSDYFGNAQVPATESETELTPMVLPDHDAENGDQTVKGTNNASLIARATHYHSSSISPKIYGSPLDTRSNETILQAASAGNTDCFDNLKHMEQGFFDWTRLPISSSMPPHIQFAKSIDWASTDLGPMEEWPTALRGMCNLIMASPHPAALYWGPNFIALYNEAYTLLAGQKHPQLMGMRYRDAWPEIWHLLEEIFSNALLTGQATMKDDDCLFIQRSGFLEETYFSWSIIPLVGDDGSVVGLYNPCFEKTRRKIAERRMLTLREVGEKTAAAREVKGFWGQVLKGLEYNNLDTPFALLYSVSDDLESDGSSMHSSSGMGIKQCVLEGTLGVPEGHKAAPPHIDLRAGTEGFGKVFREASNTDRPVLLETDAGTLDASLLEGMEWRGFGDPCKVGQQDFIKFS